MIVYHSKNIEEIGARIEWTHFTAGEVEELHAMLHVEPRCELFEGQIARIQQAEKILLEMEDVQGSCIVFKRYFLSDATNQVPVIQERDACTVSYIQQPPLDGSKVAVWLYLQKGTEVKPMNNSGFHLCNLVHADLADPFYLYRHIEAFPGYVRGELCSHMVLRS